MKVQLHAGEIYSAPADVVCVSTNPQLELMAGTGGAVRELGGWEIQEECNAIIQREYERTGHRYLEPGRVALAGPGKLPCMGIVMCVAIDPFHQSSVEVIRQCTLGALRCVRNELPDARTIAMPVFASGNGRFDFAIALNTMMDALKSNDAEMEKCLIVTNDPIQVRAARNILGEE